MNVGCTWNIIKSKVFESDRFLSPISQEYRSFRLIARYYLPICFMIEIIISNRR